MTDKPTPSAPRNKPTAPGQDATHAHDAHHDGAEPIACTPMSLPGEHLVAAADLATDINPMNSPVMMPGRLPGTGREPLRVEIAVVTSKYWHSGGVDLPVSFMDVTDPALRARILHHMNAWGASANVVFRETAGVGKVRISTGLKGHWSYIGTDILLIDPSKPTMNLQGFTMNTPDSEFHRVVRHETGHTIGCPHEHMWQELVALIDPQKAIAYYGATQGWTPDEVRQQVLTPIEQRQIIGTPQPDTNSIMCYQIPGALTKNGLPILGGADIDPIDYAFIGKIYPKLVKAPVAAPSASSAPLPLAAAPGGHRHDTIEVAVPGGMTVRLPVATPEAKLAAVFDALARPAHR